MRALDVMTTTVTTVSPETSIRDLAALLCRMSISGVPVVDAEGALLGIVSEGDLLRRAELGTERRHRSWRERLTSDRDVARDYLKAHGRLVGDVMTRDVVTVAETATLDEIAGLLETRRIRRVPVVRDGKLIGIVSRANLVHALVGASTTPPEGADDVTAPDDFTIRDALLAELRGKPWAKSWATDIMVRDRVVHLWCSDDQPLEERQALRVAAENTPGVERVEEHLIEMPIGPVI